MLRATRSVLVATMLLTTTAAQAAPFTAGTLLVYRVGDGSAVLSNAATPVFLDEYTPPGECVRSVPMPTADASPNQILTQSGSATSCGLITRSADGAFVVVTGHNAAPGTAAVTATTSAAVNGIVGRVNGRMRLILRRRCPGRISTIGVLPARFPATR